MPVEPITPEIQVQEVSKIPATPGEVAHKYGHTFKKIAFTAAAVAVVALTIAIIAAAVFWGAPLTIPILAVAGSVFIGSGGIAIATNFFAEKIKKREPVDTFDNMEARIYSLVGEDYNDQKATNLRNSCTTDKDRKEVMKFLNDLKKIQNQINQIPIGQKISKESQTTIQEFLKKIPLGDYYLRELAQKIVVNSIQQGTIVAHSNPPDSLPFSALIPLLKDILGENYSDEDAKAFVNSKQNFLEQREIIKHLQTIKNKESRESLREGALKIILGQDSHNNNIESLAKVYAKLLGEPLIPETNLEPLLRNLLGPKFTPADLELVNRFINIKPELATLIIIMQEIQDSNGDLTDPEIAKRVLLQQEKVLNKLSIYLEDKNELNKILELINRVVAINNDYVPIKWETLRQVLLNLNQPSITIIHPDILNKFRIFRLEVNKDNPDYPVRRPKELKSNTLNAAYYAQKEDTFFTSNRPLVVKQSKNYVNGLLQDIETIQPKKLDYTVTQENQEVNKSATVANQFLLDVSRSEFIMNGRTFVIDQNPERVNHLIEALRNVTQNNEAEMYQLSKLLAQSNSGDLITDRAQKVYAHYGRAVPSSGNEGVLVVSPHPDGYVIDIHRIFNYFEIDPEVGRKDLLFLRVHRRILITHKDLAEGYLREGSIVDTDRVTTEQEFDIDKLNLWTLVRNHLGPEKADKFIEFLSSKGADYKLPADVLNKITPILVGISNKDPTVDQQISALIASEEGNQGLVLFFEALKAVK